MSTRARSTRPHDGESPRRWFGTSGAVREASRPLRVVHPFDVPRHLHAAAIRAGVRPRSMIESGLFEQWLHALESVLLGPLARRR
jgi:hypothetical protein